MLLCPGDNSSGSRNGVASSSSSSSSSSKMNARGENDDRRRKRKRNRFCSNFYPRDSSSSAAAAAATGGLHPLTSFSWDLEQESSLEDGGDFDVSRVFENDHPTSRNQSLSTRNNSMVSNGQSSNYNDFDDMWCYTVQDFSQNQQIRSRSNSTLDNGNFVSRQAPSRSSDISHSDSYGSSSSSSMSTNFLAQLEAKRRKMSSDNTSDDALVVDLTEDGEEDSLSNISTKTKIETNSNSIESSLSKRKKRLQVDENEEGSARLRDLLKAALICAICFEPMQDITSTHCGHLFCKDCVFESVRNHGKCPMCQKKMSLTDMHPIYF